MALKGKFNPGTEAFLKSRSANKDTCPPWFIWTGILIFATVVTTSYIKDPYPRDILAFRDSLIGCLGATHQQCEPLHGNPIGTSEAGSSENVWSYDDVNQPMGWVHLKFHDMSYYVRVDDNDIVDSVIYNAIEYFYKDGKVYVKSSRSPYEGAALYITRG